MSKSPKITHERFKKGRMFCGRYQIVRRIGYGSVGEVYEALDEELDNQPIALKVVHPHLSGDKATLLRFQNEVYISRQLSHPNIARVYDFGDDGQIKFLTVEYISGCNLQELSESYTSNIIPQDEVVYLLKQIAEALAYAHKRDVTHRDIKPGNILIEKSGLAKLSDFGLAHSIETSNGLTRTGELIGTPSYLAPECFLKSTASKTADVYAFGILMFELLSGRLPFDSLSYHELGTLHQSAPLPTEILLKAKVPEPLIDLVVHCTAKDPEQRPQDGQELQNALNGTQYEADLGQSQLLLQTIVNRKRKDSFWTEERDRHIGRHVVILLSIMFPLFAIFGVNEREKIAIDLSRIEAQTQLPTARLRSLLGFGSYDLKSADDLINIKEIKGDWHTKVFLAGGFDLNTRVDDESQDTVLHHLIHESNYKMNALIDKAKSSDALNAINRAGDTALMRAVKLGNHRNVSALLIPRVAVVKKRKIPFAKQTKASQFVGILNKKGDMRGSQALYYPGADRSLTDKSGNLPLHIAIASGDAELTDILLSHGRTDEIARHDQHNGDGLAPLHLAVMLERQAITKLLLNNNFGVDARDGKGRTPLMLAVSQKPSSSSQAIVAELLRHRASLSSRDDEGRTAYDHAMIHGRENELDGRIMAQAASSVTAESGE